MFTKFDNKINIFIQEQNTKHANDIRDKFTKMNLGDEAIAQAAMDAGLSGVYAYPGTPSTEVTEYIQMAVARNPQLAIFCKWATNEKTAMEAALGMSYMGKRALVCMKHVGMNVCADAFMNAAITGVNGGLVVLAADDPSMHSSQNEQDSRFYAKFAMIPCVEPSNQQEAYDLTRYAFDLSEQLHEPVLLRVTTRMAHSRAVVQTAEVRAQNDMSFPHNVQHFILLPAFAKRNYAELVAAQPTFIKESEQSGYNFYYKGQQPEKAIVTTGIGFNYFREALGNDKGASASILKIVQYPLPEALIQQMVADGVKQILVRRYKRRFREMPVKVSLSDIKAEISALNIWRSCKCIHSPSLISKLFYICIRNDKSL